MPKFLIALACSACLVPALAENPSPEAMRNWPQWRGPLCSGAAPQANPPTTWSETENVRWRTPIPGQGDASPIVWNDRIYILTAIKTDRTAAGAGEAGDDQKGGASDGGELLTGARTPRGPFSPQTTEEAPPPQDRPDRPRGERPDRPRGPGRQGPPREVHEFVVLALDRATGKIVWQTKVHEQVPHEGTHPDASFASASPVTDGEHIFAYFGSYGLYCLDRDGKIVWKTDLGDMRVRNAFGEGASPALHRDTLVVTWDHEGDDFIVAFDKRTGKERWRVARDEPTSWATPLIVADGDQAQVIVSGSNRCRSYDLKTGEVVWECGGLTQNVIPSALTDNQTVYLMSGFRGAALKAIKLSGARGDLEGSPAVLWTYDKDTPYVPSGLLHRDLLYFPSNNRAMLTCLDAKTGQARYGPERLEGLRNIYASLVAAGDHVFIMDRDGVTLVLQAGPELKIVATNKLDDSFDSSPALAGDEIFLRGSKQLYCIARGR